jgi:two-component system, NarL family, invasion response regulator UvrY
VKILIVDDHPIVRAGLRRLLAAEAGVDIREATSGKEALSIFREQAPVLVILDLNLPGVSGIEVITRLKTADPGARVLVLSMHDDHIHVTRALQAGAAGYVSKNAPPAELLEAIRRVAAGHTYIEHEIAEGLVFSNIRTPSHPLQDLSARDLEILRLLAQGCTLSQIADTLGIGYKTVANNCSRIKAKLGTTSTADLIRLAIQSGLIGRDTSLSEPVSAPAEPAGHPNG